MWNFNFSQQLHIPQRLLHKIVNDKGGPEKPKTKEKRNKSVNIKLKFLLVDKLFMAIQRKWSVVISKVSKSVKVWLLLRSYSKLHERQG